MSISISISCICPCTFRFCVGCSASRWKGCCCAAGHRHRPTSKSVAVPNIKVCGTARPFKPGSFPPTTTSNHEHQFLACDTWCVTFAYVWCNSQNRAYLMACCIIALRLGLLKSQLYTLSFSYSFAHRDCNANTMNHQHHPHINYIHPNTCHPQYVGVYINTFEHIMKLEGGGGFYFMNHWIYQLEVRLQ